MMNRNDNFSPLFIGIYASMWSWRSYRHEVRRLEEYMYIPRYMARLLNTQTYAYILVTSNTYNIDYHQQVTLYLNIFQFFGTACSWITLSLMTDLSAAWTR